jgi:hypothetical protein
MMLDFYTESFNFGNNQPQGFQYMPREFMGSSVNSDAYSGAAPLSALVCPTALYPGVRAQVT